MDRNGLTASRLEIGDLMNQRGLLDPSFTGAVIYRAQRLDHAIGCFFKERLRQRTVQDLQPAQGSGVVMDRGALARMPAHDHDFKPVGFMNQIARISIVGEARVTLNLRCRDE